MLTGMKAVSNILDGESHDLWSVNTDQEYHEETRVDKETVVTDVADKELREVFETVFAKLDKLALGLSLGGVSALVFFFMTIVLVLKGGASVGPTLSLLNQFFPGYTVTMWGSLMALTYGFGTGFFAGWSFAFLRNLIAAIQFAILKRRAQRELLRQFMDFI